MVRSLLFVFRFSFTTNRNISEIGMAFDNLLNCYSSMHVSVVGFLFWCYNFTILLLPFLHLLDVIEEK